MGINTNFIRIGPADIGLYSFLGWSSMRMPSSGKNTKTAQSDFAKSVSIFLKIVGANVCQKKEKPKPCVSKYKKFRLNYNEMTQLPAF